MTRRKARWGEGSVYRPNPRSSVYWWKLSVGCVPLRGSTGKRTYQEALQFLKEKKREHLQGTLSHDTEKVTISDVVEAYLRNAKLNDKPSYQDLEGAWRLHLQKEFGHLKAAQLSTDHIERYQQKRRAAGAKPATINRAVQVLRAAYYLGADATPPKVLRVPKFPMLEEKNTRKGFVDVPEYLAFVEQCSKVGAWMLGAFETGYTWGWRREEVAQLRVGQLDMFNRCARLNANETKNDDGRVAYMTEALYQALVPLVVGKSKHEFVFTREDGSHMVDFRKTWWEVCVAVDPVANRMFCRVCKAPTINASKCANPDCGSDNVGYRGRLYHDLRRTAVRNMVRNGIPEKVAMLISGHKSANVFRRYHIVVETDLEQAAMRMGAGLKKEVARVRGGGEGSENRSNSGKNSLPEALPSEGLPVH
jgi:integrase